MWHGVLNMDEMIAAGDKITKQTNHVA